MGAVDDGEPGLGEWCVSVWLLGGEHPEEASPELAVDGRRERLAHPIAELYTQVIRPKTRLVTDVLDRAYVCRRSNIHCCLEPSGIAIREDVEGSIGRPYDYDGLGRPVSTMNSPDLESCWFVTLGLPKRKAKKKKKKKAMRQGGGGGERPLTLIFFSFNA